MFIKDKYLGGRAEGRGVAGKEAKKCELYIVLLYFL